MPARARRVAANLPLALVLAVVSLAALLAACGDVSVPPEPTAVTGAGDLQTETRDLGPFTRISVGAKIKVVVGQADTTSISIEAEPNVLPLVVTKVVDGQLVINVPPPGFVSSKGVTMTINAPAIESLALSGGGTGVLQTEVDTLNLDVSGGSVLTAIGNTKTLTFTATSAGVAKLNDLHVADATVSMADGSSAQMAVTGSLTGKIEGGASITLFGKPASVNVEQQSGATIIGG